MSVVGAFRTGKSFLLTLFLRFLKSSQGIRGAGTGGKGKGAAPSDLSMDWLSREGSTIAEGNRNKTNSSSSASSSSAAEGDEDKEGGEEGSFAWRGGSERMTTGIWMWSEPFVHFSAAAGADVAVLLMDTQGMFDNESTMTLTAQIFGISTLVSSLQIYNVQNQIGEDKLQHLALFSEYGRIALLSPSGEEEESSLTSSDRARAGAGNQAQAKENAGVNQDKVSAAAEAAAILAAWNMRHDDNGRKQWRNTITNERTYDDPVTASSTSSAADLDAATDIKEKNISAAATKVAGADAGTRNVKSAGGSSDSNTGTSGSVRDSGANAAMQAIRVAANTGGGRGHKPFQHLQFLVRDWANFDTEWPTQSASFSSNQSEVQAIADLRGEMKSELSKVISYRDKSDLQSTREQISRCFETVDAWLLPHPGTKVTNKSYDGKLDVLDPLFRVLVDRLARHIFDECLEPKRVHSRHVTAPEMLSFFEAYVRIFQEENNAMPKAMTMLDATANANNRNAYDLSMGRYKAKMSSALDKDGGQHVTPEVSVVLCCVFPLSISPPLFFH